MRPCIILYFSLCFFLSKKCELTPITIAVCKGYTDIVKLLIENGANVKNRGGVRQKCNGICCVDLSQSLKVKYFMAVQILFPGEEIVASKASSFYFCLMLLL